MENFIKYSSIENNYRDKFIKKFDLSNMLFVATEKIHGANFQIVFDYDEDITYCSRNRILAADEKFYDYQNTVKKYNFEKVVVFAKENDCVVRLYGELFGKGVNKGVDYGDEKQILFFDMSIDGIIVSYDDFHANMTAFGLPTTPFVMKGSLDETRAFDVETFNSKVLNIDDNVAEGIVIRPVKEIFYGHTRFILKKKSEKFKENKKPKKAEKIVDPVVDKWHPIVLSYVTEMRLSSLFSKMGEIENPKDIEKYMKEYVKDVKEDFLKDHDYLVESVTKKQDKQIFNISKHVVKMLNKYL